MKLDANSLGLSAALTAAILWVFCSVIVVVIPGMAMNMTGSMMHADFAGMQWSMSLVGFFVGLVIWSVFAGVFAWLMAAIYNRLI